MRTENDNGLIFDSLNAIFINNEYDDFNDIANSDNLYTIEGDNYFTDFSLVLQDLNFDGRLYTDGDITINATSVTSESKNSIIAFHTGNIVINSNEFNYKGIIFAPNGYVNINSKNIDFKGFIIAAGISISGDDVTISESDEVFTNFNTMEQEYQQRNDELITEYFDTVSALEDNPDDIIVESKYNDLRKELQTKDLLLSENEISELFCNQENISSSYNVMNKAKASFYPCKGIEKMYDVIRTSSTYSYGGKSYQYYSLSVSDKVSTSKPKLRRNYSPNIYLIGKCTNEATAKKYLNTAVSTLFGKGFGALLAGCGHPIAGKTLGVVIKSLFSRTPSPHDLYTDSSKFLRLSDVCLNTTMKYIWVKYKGRWEFGYSCDKTAWKYVLTEGKLNTKTKLYDYEKLTRSFTNKGNYYKPYVAIKTVVDYKKMYGDNASTGNNDPIGYSSTASYEIKNSDKKVVKTLKPLFIKNTTALI